MSRGALTRIRFALAVVGACVLAALVALAFADDRGGGSRAEGGEFAGAVRPQIPREDFVLRDQDGRPARLSNMRGKVAIVTFLYTTCEDTCPITAQQIRGALDDLGHDVPVLAVSVDPANDTPARAKRFLARQKLTGRARFLLGDDTRLRQVWADYGIQPQGEGFEHTAHVVLVDRTGRQRIGFPLDKLTPEGLARDIRTLEAETA